MTLPLECALCRARLRHFELLHINSVAGTAGSLFKLRRSAFSFSSDVAEDTRPAFSLAIGTCGGALELSGAEQGAIVLVFAAGQGMARTVASAGHHPALSSAMSDGSLLASDSGVCDFRVSVAVSPKVSPSIEQRNRFASVRALRRFQQRSSAFPISVCAPSKCQCRNNKVMTFCSKQREFLSHNLLQSVDEGFLNNSKVSVHQLRIKVVSGESQRLEGGEGKRELTSTNEKLISSAPPATSKSPTTIKNVTKDTTNLSTSKPASAPTPSTEPSVPVKPKSLVDDVSPFAADRMKLQMSSTSSQYNRTSSGRATIDSGKQVLDAFEQGEKDGQITKFGQSIVPKSIFDDVRQTQEEKHADKFLFNLRPGDILLVFSFLLITGLIFSTAFIVWKVGSLQ